ncbi:serine hydrolase domain-containing protein [Cognatiyoonia sp. IB215182]|uniref:serine hydrolase domain-containing protein n=1 Tax=Cognatiyoonia sp. IB215182 TaxID=3097353 RepID=UPI002A16FC47|nr:serine hydrolase domain-containing protein [Cognatiyoonia sp. IB215182]MDX8354719.1 serine hydrolase domain-containing protein [Cognatiyoonia sp. IB215182]
MTTGPYSMKSQPIYHHWITAQGREGGDSPSGALFPYWSFTKTAISICALKLVEACYLRLDAIVPGQPFTLRQLLQHTSGLPDYAPLKTYRAAVARKEEPWSRQELLEAAMAQGMLFDPDEGWSYSNIGYRYVRELIEETTGMPIGRVISDLLCRPLGLKSVKYWGTPEQTASLKWEAADGYDPRWVFHGCLIGSASDAAHLLHALFHGQLLRAETCREMLTRYVIGGSIRGRPWTECGYALGLMSGDVGEIGRAIGHSGGGPFSVNAVYHFPDRPDPVTVACFASGEDEGVAEFEAVKIAQDI